MRKFEVEYDKYEKRWGVYATGGDGSHVTGEWLCDCASKEIAKEIAASLKYAEYEKQRNYIHDSLSP